MKKFLRIVGNLFIIVILSITTQIGGLIYLLSIAIAYRWKRKFFLKKFVLFCLLYTLTTFLIVPFLAPIFGREKVKHTAFVQPATMMTVLMNRNYVSPELNTLLQRVATDLKSNQVSISYLDANFPFVDGFPLLPHLSHNDGKKIDLSLIYQTPSGALSDKQKSRSGYGVFVPPKSGEINQIKICENKGYFQYDYPKYLSFGSINPSLVFSEKGTKALVNSLLKQKNLESLFIEPHLKQRLSLNHPKIRYHGCRAVRHDDHIHLQIH